MRLLLFFLAFMSAKLASADDFIVRSIQFLPEIVRAGDHVVITVIIQVKPEHAHKNYNYFECLPAFIGTGMRDERKSLCSILYITNTIAEVRIIEHISRAYEPGRYKLQRLTLNDRGPLDRLDSVQINTQAERGFTVLPSKGKIHP